MFVRHFHKLHSGLRSALPLHAAASIHPIPARFFAKNTDGLECSGQPELLTKSNMVAREVALLDAFICGFQRSTTLFFGRIVSNPTDLPLFKDWLGYSMTYNGVPYLHGNAMHIHNSVEIFVALDGDFEIGYSNPGQTDNFKSPAEKSEIFTTVLKPFDLIACPAGVYHYYKNVDASKSDKQILTILPGCPSVQWAPEVVKRARENGAVCDDLGVLKNGTEGKGKHISQKAPYRKPEGGLKEGTLDDFVRRYGDHDYSLKLSGPILNQIGELESGEHRWLEIDYERIEAGGKLVVTPMDECDILVVVLSGEAKLQGKWTKTELSEILSEFDMVKLPWNQAGESIFEGCAETILLVVKSNLPHSFDFFFDPIQGGQLKKG